MIIYPLFPPAVSPFRRPHWVCRARMSLRYRWHSPCHRPVIRQTTNGIHHADDAAALPGLTGALSINPLIYSSKAGREKCLENVKINAKW